VFQFSEMLEVFRAGFRNTNGRVWDERSDHCEHVAVVGRPGLGRAGDFESPQPVSLRIQIQHPHEPDVVCESSMCCIIVTVGPTVHTFYGDRYTIKDDKETVVLYRDVESARMDLSGTLRIEVTGAMTSFRHGAIKLVLKSGAAYRFYLGPFLAFYGFSEIFYRCAHINNTSSLPGD
jgi:hypothetical protein